MLDNLCCFKEVLNVGNGVTGIQRVILLSRFQVVKFTQSSRSSDMFGYKTTKNLPKVSFVSTYFFKGQEKNDKRKCKVDVWLAFLRAHGNERVFLQFVTITMLCIPG